MADEIKQPIGEETPFEEIKTDTPPPAAVEPEPAAPTEAPPAPKITPPPPVSATPPGAQPKKQLCRFVWPPRQ